MKNTLYVVVFTGGTIYTTCHYPHKAHYQEGARFFKCDEEKTSMYDLSHFIGSFFKSDKFVEIVPKEE